MSISLIIGHIILTIDQAGWHTSPQVKIPQGLHLEFLPSHSPELQPVERLWPLVNEPIANRSFKNRQGIRRSAVSTLSNSSQTAIFNQSDHLFPLVAKKQTYIIPAQPELI